MGLMLALLGVLSIGYGVTVMLLNSGTLFFAVWYVLGALLLACGWATHVSAWTLVPAWLLRICGVGTIALAALLAGAIGLATSQLQAQGEPDLDYVVVLGAQIYRDGSPSPVLQWRLDAACAYLRENPGTRCIVSGGQGSNEPFPEAQGMAAYLRQQGIAAERVIEEPRSVNTLQNITYSMALMDVPSPRVGIVTNNFHVYRAVRIARKAGLRDACGIASYSTPWYLPNNLLREALGLVKDFAVGNI